MDDAATPAGGTDDGIGAPAWPAVPAAGGAVSEGVPHGGEPPAPRQKRPLLRWRRVRAASPVDGDFVLPAEGCADAGGGLTAPRKRFRLPWNSPVPGSAALPSDGADGCGGGLPPLPPKRPLLRWRRVPVAAAPDGGEAPVSGDGTAPPEKRSAFFRKHRPARGGDTPADAGVRPGDGPRALRTWRHFPAKLPLLPWKRSHASVAEAGTEAAVSPDDDAGGSGSAVGAAGHPDRRSPLTARHDADTGGKQPRLRRRRARADGDVSAAAAKPLTLVVGYLDVGRAKDANAYARGFAERRFEAHDEAFVSVARFNEGYFWEAHEGGGGRSYLPDVMRILKADPDARIWLPSGSRTLEVLMRDGRPLGLMLPDEQVELLRKSGREGRQASASSRMTRLRTKGEILFAFGALVFISGIGVLCAAALQSASVNVMAEAPHGAAVEQMPHRHWTDAAKIANAGGYVSKLEMVNGKWAATPKVMAPPVIIQAPVAPPPVPSPPTPVVQAPASPPVQVPSPPAAAQPQAAPDAPQAHAARPHGPRNGGQR